MLKNLQISTIDFDGLYKILKKLIEKPFFKAHDDYNLEKIESLLLDLLVCDEIDMQHKGKISCLIQKYKIQKKVNFINF